MLVLTGVIVFVVVWITDIMLLIKKQKCLIGCVRSAFLTSCPIMIVQFCPVEHLMLAQVLVSSFVKLFSLICPHTAGLQVAHLNCRSLLPIAGEVYDPVIHNSIDVFAVTDTWLDASIKDSEIFPYSFSINIVRNDRNRHGEDVAFLVSPRVKFVVRPDLCEGHIESIWIELFPLTKRSMLFCCVYRPPSQHNFLTSFLLNVKQLVLTVLV